MLWLNQAVDEELRRMQRDDLPKDAHYRREWHESRQGRAGPVRELAGWAGDRLVRAGELLRSWSVATPSTGAS